MPFEAKKKYSREQVNWFLDELERDGATLWATGAQLKTSDESILFDRAELDTRVFIQIFLLHPSFSLDQFAKKQIDNIHSGPIYILDTDNKYGYISLYFTKSQNAWLIEISKKSFYVGKDGGYYDPTPELNDYLKTIRNLKRKAEKIQDYSL